MLRIGICDDEKIYRDMVKEYLNNLSQERNDEEYEIYEYEEGEDVVGISNIDLLYLDIQMNGISGLNVKDRMQSENSYTKIIFMTSHSESMQDAFGKNVMGFLQKPFDYNEFLRRTNVAMEACKRDKRFIIYNEYGEIRKINIRDIVYIKSLGRYVCIHIEGESREIISEKSIKAYKNELGKAFDMCHRSYLVNLCKVEKVGMDAIMEDGTHIPISRRCMKTFKESVKRSIWGED